MCAHTHTLQQPVGSLKHQGGRGSTFHSRFFGAQIRVKNIDEIIFFILTHDWYIFWKINPEDTKDKFQLFLFRQQEQIHKELVLVFDVDDCTVPHY